MTSTNLFAKSETLSVDERMEKARKLIADADYVLVGAGAGLSAAAGLVYDGPDFEREFGEWISRYGITDLYSSSFYPFQTEEERWAYWAKHIWFCRYRIGATPLYRELLKLVEGKNYFVITTNADGQFLKSGFSKERLFYTQGDYAYLQDAKGEDKRLYYNEATVMEMMANTRNCRIPSTMIPHDPSNGHMMTPNLRCDDTFVEDAEWHTMLSRYDNFVNEAAFGRLVMLEFGIGFNTPAIIRFPFERMAAELPETTLIRFNRDYPQLVAATPKRYLCFQETLDCNLIRRLGASRNVG